MGSLYLSPEAEEEKVWGEISDKEETVRIGRKRKRNPDNWRVKHIKKKGLRKNAPRKNISSLAGCCKRECLKNFSVQHLEKIRSEFEELSYEEQNLYLNGLLRRHESKKSSGHSRQSPRITSSGKRLGRPPAEESIFSFDYFLRNSSKIDVKVCQKAFCQVFGFGSKRTQVLRQKIKASATSVEPDKRGKHGNQPKVNEELRQLIRDHIQSFPARTSHYSRGDNHGRTYLPPDLSIARLYRNFLEIRDPEFVKMEEDNLKRKMSHEPILKLRKPIVSQHFYHDIFVSEFNIHFGYPRTDTCSTCDSLQVQINEASDEARQKLEKRLEDHKSLAEIGYTTFHNDQELSKESWKKCTST